MHTFIIFNRATFAAFYRFPSDSQCISTKFLLRWVWALVLGGKNTALVILLFSTIFSSAGAASFDCDKIKSGVEKMICDNAHLSKLDDDLRDVYDAALQNSKDQEQTRQAQREWMALRNHCQDFVCLNLVYHGRISKLINNIAENSTETTYVSKLSVFRPEYLYVVSTSHSNISVYRINNANGYLIPVPGSPFATEGRLPVSLTVNATGAFVYVANFDSHDVSVFRINTDTGVLNTIPGSPFPVGDDEAPNFVAVNPEGTLAYVAEVYSSGRFGDIMGYHIDATTGVFTPANGSPFEVSNNLEFSPDFIVINKTITGDIAYVHNEANGIFSPYRINGKTGALTLDSGKQVPIYLNPKNAVVSSTSGVFAYLIDNDEVRSKKIMAYRVNAATGDRVAVPGSPFVTNYPPSSLTVNPAGTFLYVTNQVNDKNGNIEVFRINTTTGALTLVADNSLEERKRPLSIVIDHTGTFAYVVTLDDVVQGSCSLHTYRINPTTGALTLLPLNSSTTVTLKYEDHIQIVQP